jgi:hypothetical protein
MLLSDQVLRVRTRSRISELRLRQLRFKGSGSANTKRHGINAVHLETPIPDTTPKMTAGAEEEASRAKPVPDLDTEDSQTGHDISAGWRVAGAVAGQATLVAALLFYFGWTRTQAVLGYFGINSAIAVLSVNDYILRSLSITIKILIILGLLTLILLSGHRWLSAILASQRHLLIARLAMLACVALGFILCVAGVLGLYNWVVYSTRYPLVPLMLGAGVTLVSYGFRMRRFPSPTQRLINGLPELR